MEKLKKPTQFFLFLLVISSFTHWVQSTKDSTAGVTNSITAVDRSTGGRGGAATGGGGGGGGHNSGGAGNTAGINSDNTGSSSSSSSGSGQSNFGTTNSDQPRNNDDDRSHIRSDAVRSISFLVHFMNFAIVGLSVVLLSYVLVY
ncbi:inhibitor of growth protein 1 homolog isoform X1 [Zingiber officinale]|uniref:inhibitor of growth protein 1 homolog isoform X1 n=1 Tax=Zingiber officinale TaxID=94328 RepID=UPI001C4C6FCF|nr:inhibitor of growth protein 1 homolog isoform X1 [Zingiber officinale]